MLLLIDKPAGITSHKVVARVRKALSIQQVGHSGTLDPLATGLMLVLLGPATKVARYMLAQDKSYVAKVQFGLVTDTWDISGRVLEQAKAPSPGWEHVDTVVQKHLSGTVELEVPAFSAVKSGGEALYKKARKGMDVPRIVRPMCFKGIKRLAASAWPQATWSFSCSSGSYVRSWAHSLGQRLGVGAVLSNLRRTRVGPWRVEEALSLEELEESPKALAGRGFVDLRVALRPGFREFCVAGLDARLLAHGQLPVGLEKRLVPLQREAHRAKKSIMVQVINGTSTKVLALLEIPTHGPVKIVRVLK